MTHYFQLYDVANDYSLSPVDKKYQFGDLKHAKTRAQEITDKWVAGMKTRAGPLSAYKIKWHRTSAAGTRPESKMEWNGFIHGDELTYKIIERNKNPMKKKRSTKQLANDKRLGRMAKARAADARRVNPKRKRKVAKRKKRKNPNALRKAQTAIQRATNPKRKKRKVSARSHLWHVFKCYGKSVRYLGLTTASKAHWTIRDAAVIWKTKGMAANVARSVSKWRGMSKYDIGVASGDMTSAQIAAGCKKGKA